MRLLLLALLHLHHAPAPAFASFNLLTDIEALKRELLRIVRPPPAVSSDHLVLVPRPLQPRPQPLFSPVPGLGVEGHSSDSIPPAASISTSSLFSEAAVFRPGVEDPPPPAQPPAGGHSLQPLDNTGDLPVIFPEPPEQQQYQEVIYRENVLKRQFHDKKQRDSR